MPDILDVSIGNCGYFKTHAGRKIFENLFVEYKIYFCEVNF